MLYIGLWIGWLLSVEEVWPNKLADIGTFVGGAVGPIAVIWVIGTFLSQREELSETRKELARQAEAQENTHRAMLAQQVLLRLPTATSAIFHRLWDFASNAEKTREEYESQDLSFVVKRFRALTDAEVMYGSTQTKKAEMDQRGVFEALNFALSEIDGLCIAADVADPTGALRRLVETTLRASEVRALQTKAVSYTED